MFGNYPTTASFVFARLIDHVTRESVARPSEIEVRRFKNVSEGEGVILDAREHIRTLLRLHTKRDNLDIVKMIQRFYVIRLTAYRNNIGLRINH